MVGLALKGMDAQGGGADCRFQDIVRPVEDDGGNPGHDGGPVDHGQRLLRLEDIRLQVRLPQRTFCRHALPPIIDVPFAGQSGQNIGEGR